MMAPPRISPFSIPQRAAEVLILLRCGRQRYRDLLSGRPNVVLARSLKWLAARGLVDRMASNDHARLRVEYELTAKGKELLAAMEPVMEWQRRWR